MARRRKRHHKRLKITALVFLVVVIAGAVVLYLRPLPALYPINHVGSLTGSQPVLTWPAATETAIGGTGYGVLDVNGGQTKMPIASSAKLITALTVLSHYSLQLGDQGPTITFSSADEAIYNNYLAEDGSVVKVVSGEQMSEYQALCAMLLPSANNIADSLAIWAFGSLQNYTQQADLEIQGLALHNTVVGTDASGFAPATESTSHDLVQLGEDALNNPVLAQIVGLTQANLPVVGEVKNVNSLLGQDGIIGIKTGNTDQAGGVYIFAAKDSVGSYPLTVVGAIEGAPTLEDALSQTKPLLDSAKDNFKVATVTSSGQVVGNYKTPWGEYVSILASRNLNALVWSGQTVTPAVSDSAVYAPQPAGTIVGTLNLPEANSGSVNLVLAQKLASPPWWWRIFHK
jgi:D-alanyl-D-alanine carboxypeptidase (penicillin-binding protein 5/6)